MEAQRLVEEKGYEDALFYVCRLIRKKKSKLKEETYKGELQDVRIELNELEEIKESIIQSKRRT